MGVRCVIGCTVCAYVDKRLQSTLIANLVLLFFVCLVSHIAVAFRFCCKCEKTHWNNQVPEMTLLGNELGTCRNMYSSGCTYTHGVCTICHLWCDFHWCQPKEFSTRLHTCTQLCASHSYVRSVCETFDTYVCTYIQYVRVFPKLHIPHAYPYPLAHVRTYISST